MQSRLRSVSSFSTALARLRHVAGFPSGLVISFFFSFYLFVNMVSWVGSIWGFWGVITPVIVSMAITTFLVLRWQSHLVVSASTVDEPDKNQLSERRGIIVLVGLDSAAPGTTFLRLMDQAVKCEYLAFVTTMQDDELGVTTQLRDHILPSTKRVLAPAKVRVWGGNNAESLPDIERSVGEAIAWMERHGVHESEIVVDVTKGRRAMEFGALIAADRTNVEVQYMAADWHHVDNKPRPGTQGFMVVRTLWDTVGPEASPLAPPAAHT